MTETYTAGTGPITTQHRPLIAEFFGIVVLMIIGPGSAVLAADRIGVLGVAFAFGFALLAMAYTIGHISGCHINPAITLAFFLAKKIDAKTAGLYMAVQAAGAIVGALIIYIISENGDLDATGGIFASNGWGEEIGSSFGIGSAIAVEVVFTAFFVLVVLATTTSKYPAGFGGLAAGLTLGMIHMATIPVDNTSVNPARSLGTAVFGGSDALAQLWVFIVFPLVGAAVGYGIWSLVFDKSEH
jgi:aquaporin Z